MSRKKNTLTSHDHNLNLDTCTKSSSSIHINLHTCQVNLGPRNTSADLSDALSTDMQASCVTAKSRVLSSNKIKLAMYNTG